jgi:hypothetical protein
MNREELVKEIRKYQTLIKTHESSVITCREKVKSLYSELKSCGLTAYM